jgi:hypothetical protein
MSVRDRMTMNVGDQDPTWRYLLEKLGHVALFSWLIVCVIRWAPWQVAVAIALLYTIGGKILWLVGCRARALEDSGQGLPQFRLTRGALVNSRLVREDGTPVELWYELRDTAFDLLLALLPAIVALRLGVLSAVVTMAAVLSWGVIIAVLFNNRWSSPGDVG